MENTDDKKLSKTERVAQHFADLINAGLDREARRIQKEHLFKNALGARLKVSNPDNVDDIREVLKARAEALEHRKTRLSNEDNTDDKK